MIPFAHFAVWEWLNMFHHTIHGEPEHLFSGLKRGTSDKMGVNWSAGADHQSRSLYTEIAMDLQEVWDGRRVAPSKSALGRNIVFLDVAVRYCHPAPPSVCAVRMMNQTQDQAGFRWQI
tara:strand:- start:94 stop:450 length:357 start_codon:yes stop_codon:yes gene_type:complete